MFSTNDDWNAGTEQDILNQSLFGSETNAVKLLSFTKLLNSSQPNGNTTTTTDKSNLSKRKLQLDDTEQDGKKKKKKKVVVAEDDKKVLLSVRVKKKKKKKKKSVDTCTPSASDVENVKNSAVTDPGEDGSKLNDDACDQTLSADQLQKKKDENEGVVKSLNEKTPERTTDKDKRKRKKRKRKVMDIADDGGLENLRPQVPCVENSNDNANIDSCSQVNDHEDFNELYSESDDASVTPTRKKKRRKEKGKEGDVFVISDSTLDIPEPTQNEQRLSTDPNDDKITKLTAHQKKKVKKKEKLDSNDVKSTVPPLDNKPGDKCGNNVEEEKPKKKKKKKEKSAKVANEKQCDQPSTEPATPAAPFLNHKPNGPAKGSASKYNKFQKKLMEKLKGGQFRWINERLYSCKSQEAENMFMADPNLFQVYHKGFHAQVQQWPQNPVDVMVEYVKQRGEDVVVADFGCGDAKLSSSVTNKVHSFDLVAVNERVTACDMRKVPIAGKSVDIAVFCLSLMGTNLVDFLTEAHRVLKSGGVLKIAEVKSRFVDVDKFIADVSSLGFSLLQQDDSNKMFILLDFQKTSAQGEKTRRATDITLNPCIYKRR